MAFDRTKGLLDKDLDSLRELLVHELQDLHDAEERLVDGLEEMADEAHAPQLKRVFSEHLEETRTHVSRIEEALELLGEDSGKRTYEAIKGLIREGKEMIGHKGSPPVHDSGLAAVARRVEHYEISAYETVCALARRLAERQVERLMQQTLEEERRSAEAFAHMAQETLYPSAQGNVAVEG